MGVQHEVYLDYNGSAPLDPRVAEAMLPVLLEGIGNASAVHRFGCRQAAAVDHAREQVAALVGGRSSDVVFTAGATEANNLALHGAVLAAPVDRPRILISAVEHASVRETAQWLSDQGIAKVDAIPVTRGGVVDPDAVGMMIDSDVLLVSVMAANSETGVLNPVAKISERVHAAGALFHCDATQMVGRLPFGLQESGADLVSMSGHKICGPGGVGALIGTRQSLRQLRPVIHGGGHERGLRSGSTNVAGTVGLGAAAEIAVEERNSEAERVSGLRDRMVAEIKERILDVYENGDSSRRLPNTASFQFAGADADAVVTQMDPIAVSTGSACSSGSIEPSAVLLAMGVSREAAYESVRFSLGRFTTDADIDAAVEGTVTAVDYVRAMSRENG
ncbi:cysteine desulfurase family protein [Candidatus Poriferisocius sp.]|uniref:cysteine desulfurase family protein n=1 Tax=Candidatus Poriferisocius sp. TaxID=3101276 RepID=UPI003B027B08